MNFWFIIFLIVAALGVATGLGRAFAREEDTRQVAGGAAVLCTVLALVTLALSSATLVSTKSVGIVTSFGRPTGTLSNGLHWTAPWAKVAEFDAAIQTDNHSGADKGDTTPCTTVRLGGQSTACVDNSVRWRIKQAAADDLFRDYRDFDRVRDSLVTRELNASLNEVFSSFDPLATIGTASDDKQKFALDKMADDVAARLRAKIGGQVEVLNVIIPLVRFDAGTEDRIRQYQVALADTRIAEQRKATATAEAAANAALTASVTNSPNVLVSKCLDVLAQMVKDKQAVPAGFNCWPGGSTPLVAVK